ncbi:hypothetical protein RUMHYD_00990 [Blautia hydrogenotrophica DSM 10507]|uniref:Uncharacterized protein n=1 Tax=Blautia hydrogenotrophica (strain DSM 10507 / JCM 14656 / S5a33) TaxID=476272 RepID=C0CJJ2_BLAHS|nr:hypothetical protein RUMHYD_00990 [Blautia hydrogenotrophica DSM 10507]
MIKRVSSYREKSKLIKRESRSVIVNKQQIWDNTFIKVVHNE